MHKILVGFLLVLGAFGAALVAAVLLIDGERLRKVAIDYIESGGGVDLEIERVERTIGLSPRIEVHGVRLRQPEFTDSPLLEIEYAAFDVDLLSFLFEPVKLRHVVIESPLIVLPVADEGLLYWGPVIADLLERLRRFDWAVHGFSIVELEIEALHTVRDARALMAVASVEGTMPHVSDLALEVRGLSGDLETALPVPATGSIEIDELKLFHPDAMRVGLEANGRIGERPLTARAEIGNLLKGDPAARGAVQATFELGASALQVNGTASRGAGPHFDLDVDLAVKDLAKLAESQVRFGLSDDGDAWDMSDISAAIGGATVAGALRLERREPRPLLTGALKIGGQWFGSAERSDAGAAAAGASSSPEAAAAPDDAGAASDERSGGAGNLLRLAVERLDRLDAMLDLEGEDVKFSAIPVTRLRVHARLQDGRLEIDPIESEILAGIANARLAVAAGGAPPRLQLAVDFRGIDTSELAAALEIDRDVFGELEGNLELNSAEPQAFIESGAGSATLLMSGGSLSAALAHLVDMDFAERIVGKLKKGETTPIRCAIADVAGQNGVFETQTLIVDTGDVKLVGAGTLNLAERTIDLVLRPYGKDFNLLSADAPLRVSGQLRKPDVAPEKGPLVASLLTPIEIGRTENADCEALIRGASEAMNDRARRGSVRRNRP